MEDTVYILGAGFNQCVNDWYGLKPPMATNFFQTILRSEKYTDGEFFKEVKCVFEYIETYWQKNKDDLLNKPFDLEECFTFLELQYYEAIEKEDKEKSSKLLTIFFTLKTLLSEFLSEFNIFTHTSDVLRQFGDYVYKEKPVIITFNYDCILEEAIESASGVRINIPDSFSRTPNSGAQVPDEELPYSHHNWNRPLGYGIKFDEVQLHRAGLSTYVERERFYGHPENDLYNWKILKLHGSLNWFKYMQPIHPDLKDTLPPDKKENIILAKGYWHFGMPPIINNWLVDSIIITPILYKETYYKMKLFSDLWIQAKLHLSQCRRLIIIGYSFPTTDFAIRKILLEAFRDNKLDELIVVNPNTSVVAIIKGLVHFSRPISICSGLKEFLK
jgi:hypothetical protein